MWSLRVLRVLWWGMFKNERLIELTDIPHMEPGAPCPLVFATEHAVVVSYYLAFPETKEGKECPCGVITFNGVWSHVFGAPNDETLNGHPLWNIGLRSYGFYEVLDSSWIATLCRRNRVHYFHRDSMFDDVRHFIFTFHDTTLEVAADSYKVSVEPGEPLDCITRRVHDRKNWGSVRTAVK